MSVVGVHTLRDMLGHKTATQADKHHPAPFGPRPCCPPRDGDRPRLRDGRPPHGRLPTALALIHCRTIGGAA